MTVVIQGKTMVRAAHGARRLVEVEVKKPKFHGTPKRTGRAHVSDHTLHHWADKAFTDGQEVYSTAGVEAHEAADYATPYERLMEVYHRWQSTRIDSGIVETDAYTEYTGLMMMARHIMRSSILMDHYDDFTVPYVKSGANKYSPPTLLAVHAVNLTLKINEECDKPARDEEGAPQAPARVKDFYRKGQVGFAIGILMRNAHGTAAAQVLTQAVQRIDPDFVVDPVRCDARTPSTVAGMLSAFGAANRHRKCT